MRLAMKMPPKKRPTDGDFANGAHDTDPRENQSAEVIDLASRSVLPSVANKKSSDTMGMVAGIAIVAALGLVTLWSMNSARLDDADATPAGDVAADAGAAPAAIAVGPAPVTTGVAPQQQVVRADPAPAPILSNNPNLAPGTASNPNNSPTIVFDALITSAVRNCNGGLASRMCAECQACILPLHVGSRLTSMPPAFTWLLSFVVCLSSPMRSMTRQM